MATSRVSLQLPNLPESKHNVSTLDNQQQQQHPSVVLGSLRQQQQQHQGGGTSSGTTPPSRRVSGVSLSDEDQHRRMMDVLVRTQNQLEIEHDKIYAIQVYERSQEKIEIESRLAVMETLRRARELLEECQNSLNRLSEKSVLETVANPASVELEKFYDKVGKIVKGSS